MKRTIAFALAALFCLGLAACGEAGPEPTSTRAVPEPTTQTADAPEAKEIFNNGGRYVKYGGDVYYWQYTADCFEPSTYTGNFAEAPGVRRPLIRRGADGTRESVFAEDGSGRIWIYGGRFYFTRPEEDDEYSPRIFSTAMEADAAGNVKDRRELGPGSIFALDEARGLVVASVGRLNEGNHYVEHGICVINAETGKRTELPAANAELLLYDEASATLYYWDISDFRDTPLDERAVKLCGADVTTGKQRDVAWLEPREFEKSFEDADAIEFDKTWLMDDTLYAVMSGYSGNGYHPMGSVLAIIDMAGDNVEYANTKEAPDYLRSGVDELFWRGDELYVRAGGGEEWLMLSREDLAGLGLPEGSFYEEDAFASMSDLDYVDGALFFAIQRGLHNESEDYSWRYITYDLESMHVYRKDLASGKIEELYSFEKDFT